MHECSPAPPFIVFVTLVKSLQASVCSSENGNDAAYPKVWWEFNKGFAITPPGAWHMSDVPNGKYCQNFPREFLGTNLTYAWPLCLIFCVCLLNSQLLSNGAGSDWWLFPFSVFYDSRIPADNPCAQLDRWGRAILRSWNSYSSLINNCVNDFDAKVNGGLIVSAAVIEEISGKHVGRSQVSDTAPPPSAEACGHRLGAVDEKGVTGPQTLSKAAAFFGGTSHSVKAKRVPHISGVERSPRLYTITEALKLRTKRLLSCFLYGLGRQGSWEEGCIHKMFLPRWKHP